jgi:long-chain acyl-CoA synthetase
MTKTENTTFPRLLLEHGKTRPQHPAFREKDLGIWQTWNWQQVNEEVRALACGLAAQGFQRGMNLAIIGDNRPRLYWAMMAAQCLGGIPVPLYQDAPAADMAYVLENAEIAFALSKIRNRSINYSTSNSTMPAYSTSVLKMNAACGIIISQN